MSGLGGESEKCLVDTNVLCLNILCVIPKIVQVLSQKIKISVILVVPLVVAVLAIPHLHCVTMLYSQPKSHLILWILLGVIHESQFTNFIQVYKEYVQGRGGNMLSVLMIRIKNGPDICFLIIHSLTSPLIMYSKFVWSNAKVSRMSDDWPLS